MKILEPYDLSRTRRTQDSFDAFGYNDRSEVIDSKRYEGADITDLSSPVALDAFAYEFDPIGNRIESSIGVLPATTYTTNELNQYSQVSTLSPQPSHDSDGNLTEQDGWFYKWNAENRLVEAYSFAADKKLEFVYDYLGRRVEKKVTQISTVTVTGEERFLYDVWNLIATYQLQTSNLTLQTSYTWGLDLSQTLQGAGGVGGLLGVEEISGAHQGLYAFAFDVNGNVSEVYDDTGAVAAHYEYSPFGEVTRSNGAYADANAFRFSTKYLDAETGFYYYGYRYYDAETGRWLSRDPIEESGGINLYGFVGNDTVNQWDYLGMFNWRDPWGGGQGFIPGRNTAARLQNGAIGATSGAAAGATVGAGVGAAIGAVGAGVGAAPGAVAGATAGGIGGAISGFISGVTANPNASAGSVATGGAISGAFSGLTGGAGGALGATAGRGGTTALTHYASSQNAAIINSTQQLGRSASSSLWATTGRAAGTTVAGRTGVAITGQAASAFRPVVAAGPLSAYGRFAGFNSAGSGVLSLSNGAYLSGGGINGQLARWYGLDALTNGVIGFTTPPLFGCK